MFYKIYHKDILNFVKNKEKIIKEKVINNIIHLNIGINFDDLYIDKDAGYVQHSMIHDEDLRFDEETGHILNDSSDAYPQDFIRFDLFRLERNIKKDLEITMSFLVKKLNYCLQAKLNNKPNPCGVLIFLNGKSFDEGILLMNLQTN